jgi:hypothetical protein
VRTLTGWQKLTLELKVRLALEREVMMMIGVELGLLETKRTG